MIYVKNDSIDTVVGMENAGRVIEEEIQEGKLEQLWKIGEPDTEGYFTLENSKVPKFITLLLSGLEIKGNITLAWIAFRLFTRFTMLLFIFRSYS